MQTHNKFNKLKTQLYGLRISQINIKQLVGNYVQDEQENSYCIYRNRRIRYG